MEMEGWVRVKAWRRGERRKELGGGGGVNLGGWRGELGERGGKEEERGEEGTYFIPRELPQVSQ